MSCNNIWTECCLGDVVELSQGLAINKGTKHLLQETGLPLLRITDLLNNTECQYVNEFEVSKKCISDIDDLIYTRTGQVGYIFTSRIGVVHNNCFKITITKQNVDKKFMYWFLFQDKTREFANSIAMGSVQKDLSHSAFKSIPFKYPSLPVQKRIAAILSSLDDKIENNRKTCEKLEEIAQAIFKRWFVDSEFPNEEGLPYKSNGGEMVHCEELGKEIPKGWESVKLTDIADIIGGGTPKTTVEDYWNGDIPWFSVVDAPNSGQVFVVDTEKHITTLGLKESSAKLLPRGTTIISARGTVGKCAITAVPMAMNQSCYGIKSKNESFNYLIYLFVIKMVEALKQRSHGSVFDTITIATIEMIHFSFSEIIAKKMAEVISSLFDKIAALQYENCTLEQIRDAILPELMSGEIAMDEG